MSTEVYIQLIRKSDGCPYERVYMGGNALRHELDVESMEATTMGCYAINLGGVLGAQTFINEHFDTIGRYNGSTDMNDWPDGDFHYWLVVEP